MAEHAATVHTFECDRCGATRPGKHRHHPGGTLTLDCWDKALDGAIHAGPGVRQQLCRVCTDELRDWINAEVEPR